MVDQSGAVVTTALSQVQDRPRPLRCRLSFHPWDPTWSEPRIVPDIIHTAEGRQLMGYYWTSHRVCPACGAIQTRTAPLKK